MLKLFTHKGFTISYRVIGNGPEPVLAFHGFGVDSGMWQAFAESVSSKFTMVCVDALFHGQSKMPEGRTHNSPLQYEELVDIHFGLMEALGFAKFWYAGYSMGGRLALGMLKQDASRAMGTMLFAPDGLVHRPWYRGLAHSRLGYRLYDHWVRKPGLFDLITDTALRLKFIDERLFTFLKGHSSSLEKRALVRSIWFSLRHIEPELETVAQNVKAAEIPVWLFVGKFDSIIKPLHAKQLRELLGEQMHYNLLETGHAMIYDRTGKQVLELLQKRKGA